MTWKMLDLFSGIGGFSLAAKWVWGDELEIVAFCEIDKFCQKVLKKHWPNVKRIKDIRDVKGDEFGSIDLLCGGPPCQPASCAGKRRGTEDDRWLWDETLRVTKAVKPRWCLFENPTGILSLQRGVPFEHLLLDLEAQGYTVQAFVLPAASVNAPHRRDRVWIVAHAEITGERPAQQSRQRSSIEQGSQDVADQHNKGFSAQWEQERIRKKKGKTRPGIERTNMLGRKWNSSWWSTEPDVGRTLNGLPKGLDGHLWTDGWEDGVPRVAKGIPNRVDRLKALGNSIVWLVVVPMLQAIKEIDDGIKANTSL